MLALLSRVVLDLDVSLAEVAELLDDEQALVFLLVLLLRRIKVHEPFEVQALEAGEVGEAYRNLAELVAIDQQILKICAFSNIIRQSPQFVLIHVQVLQLG